jgi:hypothetical protein
MTQTSWSAPSFFLFIKWLAISSTADVLVTPTLKSGKFDFVTGNEMSYLPQRHRCLDWLEIIVITDNAFKDNNKIPIDSLDGLKCNSTKMSAVTTMYSSDNRSLFIYGTHSLTTGETHGSCGRKIIESKNYKTRKKSEFLLLIYIFSKKYSDNRTARCNFLLFAKSH